jgi:hypothetical protein
MTYPVVAESNIEEAAELTDSALELVGGGGIGGGGTGGPVTMGVGQGGTG